MVKLAVQINGSSVNVLTKIMREVLSTLDDIGIWTLKVLARIFY
jgi:hypothetical protein